MPQYQLQKNSGTNQTFAAWGLNNVRLTFQNLDADSLEFTQEGALFSSTPLFAMGDKLTVTYVADDSTVTVIFVGYVRTITPAADGRAHRLEYVAYNPWEWMRRVVFQQLWNLAMTPTIAGGGGLAGNYISRVLLGVGVDGTFLTIGDIVAEIMDYAISTAGVPMQFAAFEETTLIPAEETRDLTIVGALLRILRWLPDCVTWWDYTTSPPTLHIAHQDDLGGRTMAVPAPGTPPADCTDRITSLRLNPRYDLVIGGVVLRYLIAGENDYGWNEVTIDQSPGGVTGFEYNCLVETLDLIPGRPETALMQQVETSALPAALHVGTPSGGDDADQGDAVALLQRHFPRLKKSDVSSIVVSTLAYYEADGTFITNSAGLGDYDNELTNGAITPWMKTSLSIVSKTISFKMVASYKITDAVTGGVATFKHFFEAKTLLATNALTQTYKLVTAPGVWSESPPSGLAAALYASLSILPWTGEVRTIERFVSRGLRPGQVLNFSGGNADWSAANALIQRTVENLDTGETIATLGPPEHLSAQDLIDRLRLGRDRAAVSSISQRVNGYDSNPLSNFDLATDHPHKPAPGQLPTTGAIIGYTGSPTAVREITTREVDYCDNSSGSNVWRKALVQISEPYDSGA